MAHGHGKETLDTGAVYEGEFYNDKKQGLGKIKWPNGDYYEGKWY
jgi:hypothetical protein